MKRLLLAAAFVLAATGAALADTLPVSLKATAAIEGDTVKLGDLWDNLGAQAETPIAPAPQPGKRITADARWLLAVAQNYGVNWQPATAFDRIVIERAGQTVDARLIESELREALNMEGVPGPFDFEITNRTALNMVVPTGAGPVGVAVRDLIWDSRTGRFSATVEAPAGVPTAQRQRVNGHVFSIARIPVLNRTIGRGDVITEGDIEWIEARAEAVRRDVVTDARQLVGQEPRLQVRQGAPVRLSDVRRPVLVPRNSTVTMVVKTPFMTLTAQGRASEEGGKGDVIHVTNLHSKRVVEAVVDGPGSVTVTPNGAVALAN
ncbi:MAG: flagellar basal body P-ring formation chaperone FlgA [Magnetospirillum sp.]|nr:flagellar basal body P-ring formation chaperone FlgA [Magnetospirillum sp.]